ncbi:DUF2975 domain-containing protein [Rhizobium sullae]|uniref:DUF2975 domain-containing protein n=1 Tax=Rhizobium sullae TaxID=50338 RepID=A0A2N0DDG7_RHISU|nr:DUF2975 domain-containing protein [Rhizobium sullae]PKA44147.1 DUF2975 domain-containing protein [Rhizobium sullae]
MSALKTDDNLSRIRRVGRFFSALWGLMACIVPILIVAHWYLTLSPANTGNLAPHFLQLAVVLLAGGPLVLGLVHLRRLFVLFGEGEMFGIENVARIRKFGSALLLFGLTQLAYFPLSSLASAGFGSPGERTISISFSSGAAVALGVGFVVVVIAWVMEEARKLEEEQSHTV